MASDFWSTKFNRKRFPRFVKEAMRSEVSRDNSACHVPCTFSMDEIYRAAMPHANPKQDVYFRCLCNRYCLLSFTILVGIIFLWILPLVGRLEKKTLNPVSTSLCVVVVVVVVVVHAILFRIKTFSGHFGFQSPTVRGGGGGLSNIHAKQWRELVHFGQINP